MTRYGSCLGGLSGSIADNDFTCHLAAMQAKQGCSIECASSPRGLHGVAIEERFKYPKHQLRRPKPKSQNAVNP